MVWIDWFPGGFPRFAAPYRFCNCPGTQYSIMQIIDDLTHEDLLSAAAGAAYRMWSGVVPQQPPTRLMSPSSAKPFRVAAMASGVSSYSPNVFGSPGRKERQDIRKGDSKGRLATVTVNVLPALG